MKRIIITICVLLFNNVFVFKTYASLDFKCVASHDKKVHTKLQKIICNYYGIDFSPNVYRWSDESIKFSCLPSNNGEQKFDDVVIEKNDIMQQFISSIFEEMFDFYSRNPKFLGMIFSIEHISAEKNKILINVPQYYQGLNLVAFKSHWRGLIGRSNFDGSEQELSRCIVQSVIYCLIQLFLDRDFLPIVKKVLPFDGDMMRSCRVFFQKIENNGFHKLASLSFMNFRCLNFQNLDKFESLHLQWWKSLFSYAFFRPDFSSSNFSEMLAVNNGNCFVLRKTLNPLLDSIFPQGQFGELKILTFFKGLLLKNDENDLYKSDIKMSKDLKSD